MTENEVEIEVELEEEVIALIDEHASKRGLTRNELIHEILERAIAEEGWEDKRGEQERSDDD